MLHILQRHFFPVKTFFEKILETEKSETGSASHSAMTMDRGPLCVGKVFHSQLQFS